MDCMSSCWRDDVLLLSCSDKFLRLFLQLLSRYSNWLSVGLRVRKTGNVSANSGFEWAVSASPDDFLYESAYWSMHLNSYIYGLSGRESTYHGVYEDNGPVPGLDFNKRAWEYPSMTTTEDPITVDIP